MRKFLLILLVGAVVLPTFAAVSISIAAEPYALQSITRSADTEEVLKASYGFGSSVKFDMVSDNGLALGAELGTDTYSFGKESNETAVAILARAGYNLNASGKFGLFAFAKGGLEVQLYDKAVGMVPVYGGELGVRAAVSDGINAFASCSGILSVLKGADVSYMQIRITPSVGAVFSL